MTTPENITKLKDIPGYEGIYAVNENGDVWSYPKHFKKGVWLKHSIERTGYRFVTLQVNKKRCTCYVQGLVAKAYLGDESNTKQVNHKDGNKANNHISNLEWVSPSENIKHSFSLGLSNQKGSKNAYSKLKESEVSEIRELSKKGVKGIDIAKKFRITRPTVSSIINNKTWNHVN